MMAACVLSPTVGAAEVATTKIRSVLCPLLRRRAAKKVETLMEEQKQWFPTLDLYNAVLELQDQLRGVDLGAGYDFWAKKAGNCSLVSKVLFVLHARKVILQRIGEPSAAGSAALPGEATLAGVEPNWLRFWEKDISKMSDDELDEALGDLQEERYYYRKSARRGELTDACRRENLRMELWGVAARHENTKRHLARRPRELAAAKICHAIFGFYLRRLRKQAVRFMGTRLSDSQLAAEEIHTTRVLLAGDSQQELIDAVYTLAARKIMKERDVPRATSAEGLVHLCVWTRDGLLRGPMWEEDAMWYLVNTNEVPLTLDLRADYRELRGTTDMSMAEATRFFFYYEWDQAHEWFYEEQARSVALALPVRVWREIRGTMRAAVCHPCALSLAVATRGLGLGLTLNLQNGTLNCATELPLARAQQLFFPREELQDEAAPAYWVEEKEHGHQPAEESADSSGCPGCREDQPNQLAHMEPGGCLYTEEDY